ncbi:MAG: hypothetical protein IKA87_06540 [Lentisphaeria bacterium]|nr:hypothetical protein [Lentisphaeria bacterium]
MGNALIFCGIKHCGKSTLGKLLAQNLGISFADTDDLLGSANRASVRELFKLWGEDEFRRRESALLKSLSAAERQVISLGGGALLKAENIPAVKALGSVIWCDISDEAAFARIAAEGLPPFLEQSADPLEEFKLRNRSRRETFETVCDLRFIPDTDAPPEQNVLKLQQLLLEKGII